jgi:energy-coupling factor transporter ATP-binding protein EcfA2
VRRLVTIRDLSVAWTEGRGGSGMAALDGLSLTIDAGEVVGIVGETGSGRSTLLRCLIGIVPQLVQAVVEGTIEVAGRDPRVTPVAEMARDVAIVLDDPEAQASQATVAEEVALGLENLAVPVAEMRTRVREMLDQVGLAGFDDRNPLSLSGGEQQRLAVACAVAMRPQLLLLDEPTANLDARAGRRLLGLVRDLATRRGMTVVIVEQDVELLAEHVDRIVLLDAGRVRLDATPAAAFSTLARSDPTASVPQVTAFAARLDPAAWLLPVTTEDAARWLAGRI